MENFPTRKYYDISNPAKRHVMTSMVLPGGPGQGDVSVTKNLLFVRRNAKMGAGDLRHAGDFLPKPRRPATEEKEKKTRIPADPKKDRFRGCCFFFVKNLRQIFRTIKNSETSCGGQTCRGSHTHTMVRIRTTRTTLYIYVLRTSLVRPPEELAGGRLLR